MYRQGIQLHTGRANASRDIPAVLALIAQGKLKPGLVTSVVVPIDQAVELLSGALSTKTVLTFSA